jgi:hypothetical protein
MSGRKNKVKFHAQKVCFHFIMLPKFPKYSTTAKQTIKHHCISEVVGAGFACASVTQTSSRQLNFGNNFGVGSPLVQLSHGFQVGVTLLDLCCVSTAATA